MAIIVRFCPQCGTHMEERWLGERVRPVCPACGFIYYLNPTPATGTLVEEQGKVALVRRGVAPRVGYWALPACYMEAGETTEQAAARETLEEAGLEVKIGDLLGVYSWEEANQSSGILIVYAATVVSGSLRAGDDATEVAWFGPDDLPPDDQLAFWTHRAVLDDWRRTRAIVYREATPAEAVEIDTLARTQGEPFSNFGYLVTQPGGHLLVARDRGNIVGYASMRTEEPGPTTYLDRLFVMPGYRRWGIGTRLLAKSLALAASQGAQTLQTRISAANIAVGAYLKAGFRVCGFLQPPNGKAELFLAYDFNSIPATT